MLNNIPIALLLSLGCLFVAPRLSHCEELDLQSFSIRARVSEQTILGKEAPEDFQEYDVAANFELPWKIHFMSIWDTDTRLMASAGILQGTGKNALVVSVIPELIFAFINGQFTLDLGAGGALLSRHRFGVQDYGGPFQFALTMGVSAPFYKKLELGYRFLHYSDAGLNGSDTTGADFHMIELIYRR